MINIRRSESFNSKFLSLGPTSQDHFVLSFNRVWKELLDVDATGEIEYIDVIETILGSNKKFRAFYSRLDEAIYLDIIDDNS